MFAPRRATRHRLFQGFALVLAASALFAPLSAQTPAPAAPDPAAATDNTNPNGRMRRGNNGNGNFSPADVQARMLSNLRDQFAVKDDAEWSLISERITAVFDLRRSLATGGFAFRGGGNPDRGGSQGNRGNNAGNPELAALRAAISDNLPDAEIKARLERLREVRKQNEAKLARAQEELRAVLTVRQEAVAVAAGLLN